MRTEEYGPCALGMTLDKRVFDDFTDFKCSRFVGATAWV